MDSILFQPVRIGKRTAANRFVMPPMLTLFAEEGGFVSRRLVNYYSARARGGAGIIIVEAASVMRGGRLNTRQMYISSDEFLPGLKTLATAIKKAGPLCLVQIQHGGRRAAAAANNGMQISAASPLPQRKGEMPHELSREEIAQVVESFAAAGARAQKAGFDGVELHFAHGYLVSGFLSSLTNKRSDEYGGDLLSRARIAIEIIHRTRERVGSDLIVSARITGDECIKGGIVPNDARKFAALFQEAGLDAISVSAGYTATHEEGYLSCFAPASPVPMPVPRGYWVPAAETVKKSVRIPVIAVGRLDEPALAAQVISSGKADLIALGRSHIADPDIVAKYKAGRSGTIRRCIACCYCTFTMYSGAMKCAINPEAGREADAPEPAPKPKRLLVVGGGPGGMEAARIAAIRGHVVTLMERTSRLGGAVVPASAPSFKGEMMSLVHYLSKELSTLGVDVRLNTAAEPASILAFKPDAVILATGASPLLPAIPGIDRPNVTTAVAVLEGKAPVGHNVIVAGGGGVGCDTAAHLAENGKEVTIVEMRDTDFSDTGGLAPDMEPLLRRWLLFEHMPNLPVSVIGRSSFEEVTDKGLVVRDREGERRLVPADTIVFAAGMVPNNGLRDALMHKVPEIYEIGDCVKPRKIIDAVHEAFNVSRQV